MFCRTVLGVLLALVCLVAWAPASATHGGPWHTVERVPSPDQDNTVVPAGEPFLLIGGGWDVSAGGSVIVRQGPAPDGYPGCFDDDCVLTYAFDRDAQEHTPLNIEWTGAGGNNIFISTPQVSDDGRFAVDLADGIRVYELATGAQERVDVSSEGTPGGCCAGGTPSISGDGRFVAFDSEANNLVSGDTNDCDNTSGPSCRDVFVHDRQTGETERVSVASDGGQANGPSSSPDISADGRYVAFRSFASNLVSVTGSSVAGSSLLTAQQLFVHDRQTGETSLVSVSTGGDYANSSVSGSAISGDGRIIAFSSSASDLIAEDTNNASDVFVRDIIAGTTERVSITSNGTEASAGSGSPSISADGMRVAFTSGAPEFDPGGPEDCMGVACSDSFVHERATGQTFKINVAANGTDGNARTNSPVISANGRLVLYSSAATNLVPGDDCCLLLAQRQGLVWGDFDCDGSAGTADALALLLDSSVGAAGDACPAAGTAVEVDGGAETWADFNCDGQRNPADTLPILRSVGGLPQENASCPPIGRAAALLT